ncbi:Oxidase YgaF, partial [Salmonella enterica subsp. enterica serovar Montevideo str. S5-403]
SALTEHAADIVIRTSQGREIETATLIGCAGLMADRLVKMLGVEPGFIICPFRGEYFRLAPRHNRIVNHLIYPIPDPAMPFLGVHLTRMIDGSVTVGPNAVLALKREGYRKRDVSFTDTLEIFRSAGIRRVLQNHLLSGLGEMKNSLCKSGYLRRVQKYCPSLTVNDLQPWPAGVRAQAVSPDGKLIDDFLFVTTPRSIHTCNAPSPAATSAIPIGAHIVSKVQALRESQSNPGRTLRAARMARSVDALHAVRHAAWTHYTPHLPVNPSDRKQLCNLTTLPCSASRPLSMATGATRAARRRCHPREDARGGDVIPVSNPANGKPLGNVPKMGAEETRDAIDAANRALPAWRALTAKERANILRRWFNLMMEHQDDLARLMTLEQGKPLAEAKGEISYAASFIEWFAEEGKRIYGDTIPGHQADKRLLVIKQPIGVTAAITPWNFPSAMITRKAGPALAAGCTMVLKPASQTPFSALALAELAQRAGIPAGVFNVVTGSAGDIGGELTSNPLVRKLSFTGSTEIGRQLMEQCAKDIKKVSLELGGNAPFIVFDDADLDKAVEGALASKFRNAGQTCVCANRLYVQDGVYDRFAEKLNQAVNKLAVGDGLQADVAIGPLIDEKAVAKVQEHIADALEKGARVITGGEAHKLGGNFFQPTILADVPDNAKVAKEETFGPLAPLFRFSDEADVIRQANDTEFGLAAYFYARDLSRVFRVGEALEYGIVGININTGIISNEVVINTGIISNEVAPFGGIKASGLGREGSKYGIEDYLEIKYMCIGL